jgi:hypothetical protein
LPPRHSRGPVGTTTGTSLDPCRGTVCGNSIGSNRGCLRPMTCPESK